MGSRCLKWRIKLIMKLPFGEHVIHMLYLESEEENGSFVTETMAFIVNGSKIQCFFL